MVNSIATNFTSDQAFNTELDTFLRNIKASKSEEVSIANQYWYWVTLFDGAKNRVLREYHENQQQQIELSSESRRHIYLPQILKSKNLHSLLKEHHFLELFDLNKRQQIAKDPTVRAVERQMELDSIDIKTFTCGIAPVHYVLLDRPYRLDEIEYGHFTKQVASAIGAALTEVKGKNQIADSLLQNKNSYTQVNVACLEDLVKYWEVSFKTNPGSLKRTANKAAELLYKNKQGSDTDSLKSIRESLRIIGEGDVLEFYRGSKNPFSDLTLGDDANCCIGIGRSRFSALSAYLVDPATQYIAISYNGNRNGLALTFAAKNREQETSLVVNSYELNRGKIRNFDNKRESILAAARDYTQSYSQQSGFEKTMHITLPADNYPEPLPFIRIELSLKPKLESSLYAGQMYKYHPDSVQNHFMNNWHSDIQWGSFDKGKLSHANSHIDLGLLPWPSVHSYGELKCMLGVHFR